MGPSSIQRSNQATANATISAGAETRGDQVGEAQHAGSHGRRGPFVDHGDAELESQQAGGVVDQALAFEQIDDAPGKSDLRRDGGGGHRIGGRDDRAEDHANPPIESGKEPLGLRRRRRRW